MVGAVEIYEVGPRDGLRQGEVEGELELAVLARLGGRRRVADGERLGLVELLLHLRLEIHRGARSGVWVGV